MNKITELKETRKSIIKDYSAKEIPLLTIDKLSTNLAFYQHVIIKEIIEETSDTKSFILVPDLKEGTKSLLPFNPGQYISVKLNIKEDYVTTRAYSLSSSSSEAKKGFYRITIKKVPGGLVSNYFLNEVTIGTKLVVSKPVGDFCYNPLRDEQNVICIAGGSGITPFISLAKSLSEGRFNFHLTIIYSVKTAADIIFKEELMALSKHPNIDIKITLTREEKPDYHHGHITEELLKPYIKEFNTIFMCGPKALYKSMNGILSSFNIPKKCVHYENFSLDYTPDLDTTYKLKVILKDEAIVTSCKSNETLLVALEKARIKAPAICRVGTCGYCKSILLDGKVKMFGGNLKKAEIENDYIHPCVAYPESDIVIRLDI